MGNQWLGYDEWLDSNWNDEDYYIDFCELCKKDFEIYMTESNDNICQECREK